jgi:hypothetical protein
MLWRGKRLQAAGTEMTGPRPRPRLSLNARKAQGLAYFLTFMACIPAANWMIGHIGTSCAPGGPCLVPVLP